MQKDTGILYKVFRNLKKQLSSSSDSHLSLMHADSPNSDVLTQSELFADQFNKPAFHEPIPLTFGTDVSEKFYRLFTLKELRDSIRQAKPTTPGEDTISAVHFRGLSDHSLKCLLRI